MNFTSIPQHMLRNISQINPQQIQSAANSLWDSANQHVNNVLNNIPFGLSGFRESVSLCLDISPEDRLFLQHEAQAELKDILQTNRCKIDLNLSSSLTSILDNSQVSISGPPDGVHSSYLEIRQLLPITVWFDLKLNASLPSIVLNPNAQPLHEIQKKYEIAICVVPLQSAVIQPTPSNHISIYIRTNRRNDANLKTGVEELAQFIGSNNYGNIYPKLQTKIDVPSNQPTIIGRSYSMLDPIATKTSTQISVQKSATNLMANVSITGLNFNSITSARNEISDRFVVELHFTVNGQQSGILENSCRQLERLSDTFGVHILMKPNSNPSNKTMIIRGNDKEVGKLFQVREHVVQLLAKPNSTQTISTQNGTAFITIPAQNGTPFVTSSQP